MMRFWEGNRRALDSEFEREIGFHVEQATDRYVAEGQSPEAARRRALVEFGGREQVRQTLREVHGWPMLASLTFYLKTAWRFVRKAPAFSAAAILILALGIGTNTAVFSAVDTVMLRPLPFPAGDQLMALTQQNRRSEDGDRFVAPARLEDWNRLASATFAGITGYYKDDFTETSGPLPERLTGEYVAPRFLHVLGIEPTLGRDFLPAEEHFGGPAAVLISDGLWKRRFHGDPAVLGKSLHLGGTLLPIVGVMPATFAFPGREVDLWTPSPPDAPYAGSRESTWFAVVGRSRPGVSVSQARANLATVQRQLGAQFPKTDADLDAELTPLKETVVGGVRGSLWLLYGSVSLLLLIACSNLAALLLARTADREHEISIRFSLGASRRAIVAQLLAEVMALALLGSLLGLVLAVLALHGFQSLAKELPRADEITLNWHVLFYSGLCAAATTVICGLYPALRGTRRELARSLAGDRRTQAGSRGSAQWILVGVQVTLSVVLLTGAGLLLRSWRAVEQVSPGFVADQVLTFQVSGSWGETANRKLLTQNIDRRLDSLRTLPGVAAASSSAGLPGLPGTYSQELKLDGHTQAGRPILADVRYISDGYFDTVQIPRMRGNVCKQGSSTFDAVVNRSFVDRYFGGDQPVGHMLTADISASFAEPARVVGVVGDARERGLGEEPLPTVYFCVSAPSASPNYLVRTRGADPMAMAEAVRRRIHELEPSRSVFAIMPLTEHIDDASFENRLRTVLLLSFAGTALLLACVGLYGTLSYLGRMRRREIGLRLILGATRAQVGLRFLGQGLRVSVLGWAAGAVLSVLGSRALARMLYGVSALDGVTYVSVLLFVLAAASFACALPARRAALVEPATAMRES